MRKKPNIIMGKIITNRVVMLQFNDRNAPHFLDELNEAIKEGFYYKTYVEIGPEDKLIILEKME
jgi:hypothetical protein